MNSNDLRRKFLDFFKERGHAIIPSASLIPENDPTTLFIGSGMQPLISYLLGKKHPLGNRLTNCQKSFRAADIEDVGDNRHTTFFEMLGNWSLGDYFKKEQLNWIFEFLIGELKINPEKLYVTVFRGNKKIGIERDSESVQIWKEIFFRHEILAKDIDFSEKKGMRDGKIFYCDETKNWWSRSGVPGSMPLDEPGGPDSEIFYDLGADLKRHENSIWKDKPCHINCDCGRFIEIGNSVFMEYVKTEKGFERLPQKNVDFGGGLERIAMVVQGKTSVFDIDLFIDILNKIKELSGGKEYKDNAKAFEIITDHIKGAVFIIFEGIEPSNTEHGYVLRRLLRRAIRYGKLLNLPENFLMPLSQKVIEIYQEVYPEVKSKETDILTVIQNEKEMFEKTLEQGLAQFDKLLKVKIKRQKPKIIEGKEVFYLYQSYGFPLEFTEELAREKGLAVDKKGFQEALARHREISRAGVEGKFGGHGLSLKTGEVKVRDKSELEKVTRLHTVTHLLHAALRQILGKEVRQQGSDITIERTRFDFRFPRKLSLEEIKKVEDLVNQKIKEDLEVTKEEMSYQEAIESGALAYFKEKYPERVTVYFIGPSLGSGQVFSKELCGGPHVKRTSIIGQFKIIKEESCGAGTRRIRAIVK